MGMAYDRREPRDKRLTKKNERNERTSIQLVIDIFEDGTETIGNDGKGPTGKSEVLNDIMIRCFAVR